jgi:hypothetical protein
MAWGKQAAVCAAALLLALLAAAPAQGSQRIGLNASHVSLAVDASGRALVTFREAGRTRRLLAWGAVNARPPQRGRPQVRFRLRYTSSTRIANACGAYDGTQLAWFVTGCRAPDGSYWALQSWQRLLPGRGKRPTRRQAAWELRLSHWRGPLPEFVVKLDWSYRRYDHLYGWYSYLGRPIYGFRVTRNGRPLDGYGRNVYLDTYNSAYGRGWRREGGFLTQRPNGNFCWGFFPREGRPAGNGARYRATVIGPGVMPDMHWDSPALGPYNRDHDRAANAEQRQLAGGSRFCRPN